MTKEGQLYLSFDNYSCLFIFRNVDKIKLYFHIDFNKIK